jgi:molybdopterin synthase sulfur carrier subunit
MKLQLRYFASIRESLGLEQETIELSVSVHTIDDLRAHLRLRGGIWSEVLGEGKVLRCALNHQMVNSSTELIDGAEVAFFPPVTGG